MNFLQKIYQIPNEVLYNMGKRSYLEYTVKQLPLDKQPVAKKMAQDLHQISIAADPLVFFQRLSDFNEFVAVKSIDPLLPPMQKTAMFTSGSWNGGEATFLGNRSMGSKIWNYFPNPFGVFAYFGENYWAVGRGINLVRETIQSDGFALKGAPGLSDKKLISYYKRLLELDMENLWVEFVAHEMAFGNFFALPHYGTKSRKLVKFEILYPPRLYPIFNKNTEEVEAYQYTCGRINRVYTADEVKHAMLPSLFGRAMGAPPLLSCVVEIETALMTTNFNNAFMQKGGLIGKLISLKVPDENNSIAGGANAEFVRQIQAQLDYIGSGTKAAQSMMAISGVDDVFDITKPGEIELNFQATRDALDKRICNTLGIPSEKIGIPRSTTAQYQPSLVENVVNAQYDMTVNSYTARAARFFNKYLLQEQLGIYDAKLVPAGRYGAITLAAAQTIKELAAAGPLTTVNEARTHILGWAPLPANDPRGQLVLDNSMTRDPEAVRAMIAPETLDPDLDDIDKISRENGLFIKIGGADGGEISKFRPVSVSRKED